VSVEAMIEFAWWMAIPHIVIGLVFAFFGAEQVQLIETQLQTWLHRQAPTSRRSC
jgi:hypothetical protein